MAANDAAQFGIFVQGNGFHIEGLATAGGSLHQNPSSHQPTPNSPPPTKNHQSKETIMKCDYCNSDHTRRIFDIHNAGTSISTGSGFGYATDGQVIMTNTTTVSKTLEAAGLEPPKKFSYGNVYIALVIMLFALMNFPPRWMWLLVCPAMVYAAYQYPIVWNHRNRVFPDVMRRYINQWKCGDCKRVFLDPSFKWTEGVRDWVWKEVLARNFMLTKTVKVMLGVAGLFFIYPFILSFSLVRQMPYLGGFLREYLFAFILVTIAAVKAYNAARKRNAK